MAPSFLQYYSRSGPKSDITPYTWTAARARAITTVPSAEGWLRSIRLIYLRMREAAAHGSYETICAGSISRAAGRLCSGFSRTVVVCGAAAQLWEPHRSDWDRNRHPIFVLCQARCPMITTDVNPSAVANARQNSSATGISLDVDWEMSIQRCGQMSVLTLSGLIHSTIPEPLTTCL